MLRVAAIGFLSVLASCRCDTPINPIVTGFRIEETELDFGRVLENTSATRQVHVVSTGAGRLTLTLAATPPFGVDPGLELPGGGNVPVDVTFLAGPARVEGTLTVSSPGGDLTVKLIGTGVHPKDCIASAPCHESHYDLESDTCIETVVPDGNDCTPTSTCLEKGQCLSGQCQGVARSCDDSNLCTIDGCAEGLGCVNQQRACPRPSDPCHVAVCNPASGCGEAQAADGTVCGSVDCISAHICTGGSCTTIATPDGFPCSPPTPCQGGGRCVMQQCKRPDAGVMQPELVLPIGGSPPVSRPMLLSFGGQLFGEVCGLPLAPLVPVRPDAGTSDAGPSDAGADAGSPDAGRFDAGFGCALISYTNNGFERFATPLGDGRERALLHVSNLGAVMLDADGGIEVRSLATGDLRFGVFALPGAVVPRGVASSIRSDPWVVVTTDAGSTLVRIDSDAGVEALLSLDASTPLLALDENGSAWLWGDRLGVVMFDDAGLALAPQWQDTPDAATLTLAATQGVAFAGNTYLSDAGFLHAQNWVDDAGIPLRVQERFTLLAQNRAVVFYRTCTRPLISCLPEDEELRLRAVSLLTGEVLDDARVAPPQLDARVVEASLLDLTGFPPGVAAVVQLRRDAGANALLQLTVGSMGDLSCPLPFGSDVAGAAIGNGYLWAYVNRDGGAYALEAYPLTGLPLTTSAWPLADGLSGQRRAR